MSGERPGQWIIFSAEPKLIARYVHDAGWKVETERNLRYGGTEGCAPMVTWIVKFSWDENLIAKPDESYRLALIDIFRGIGYISQQGNIE